MYIIRSSGAQWGPTRQGSGLLGHEAEGALLRDIGEGVVGLLVLWVVGGGLGSLE